MLRLVVLQQLVAVEKCKSIYHFCEFQFNNLAFWFARDSIETVILRPLNIFWRFFFHFELLLAQNTVVNKKCGKEVFFLEKTLKKHWKSIEKNVEKKLKKKHTSKKSIINNASAIRIVDVCRSVCMYFFLFLKKYTKQHTLEKSRLL